MIAALVTALVLADPASGEQAGSSGWERFDYRPTGFGNSEFLFDRSSVRRKGPVVSAWVTYDFHYSGRNDTTHIELWEVDCRQWRGRTRVAFTLDGERFYGPQRNPGKFDAIAAGTALAALANRFCGRD